MKNLIEQLAKGKTFSQYGFAGDKNCFYRWDDTLEIINTKSVVALRRKGLIGKIQILPNVIK